MAIRSFVSVRTKNIIRRTLTRRHLGTGCLLVTLVPLTLYAADELHIFQAHTVISSGQVNENFANLDGRIGTFESVLGIDDIKLNVGIGTRTPLDKLHIVANDLTSGTGPARIRLQDAALNRTWTLNLYGTGSLEGAGKFGINDQSANRFIIDGQGNVGIGTINPVSPLDVDGALTVQDGCHPDFEENALNVDACNGVARLAAGNSEHLPISLNPYGGNVGVGTTNPGAKFHVSAYESTAHGKNAAISISNTAPGSNNSWFLRTGADGTATPSGGLSIADNVGYRMVFKNDGNVGIGTTDPVTKLQVAGTTLIGSAGVNAYSPYLRANNSLSSSSTPDYSFWYDDQTGIFHPELSNLAFTVGGNEVVRIDENRNVGIGTTNPAYKLEVKGQIHASGGISVVGDVTSDDYLYHSDARLKTDILPIERGLERVKCLEGVTYRWEDPSEPQELQMGLIAQQVEDCFPEVVSTDSGGYKSVSYARLVAPLIEAVKTQSEEIAYLKAQQASTAARLARIEARLNAK